MARFAGGTTQYFDETGKPLSGGKLHFFESGSTTEKTTYSDADQSIPNTNPVILDAAGRQGDIFFSGSAKLVITDADDVQVDVIDPVGGAVTRDAFADWNSIITYDAEDITQGSNEKYYKSIINDNLGNDPTSTSGKWMEVKFVAIWDSEYTFEGGDLVIASDDALYRLTVPSSQGVDPTLETDWTKIGASGWSALVEDLTPQLGGNLDLNGFAVGAATAADLTKLNAITVPASAINYLDGLSSNVQTQLNAKAPAASPTFSGTVTLPGNWTIVVNGGNLEFRYNGTAQFEIQTDGDTVQRGHATWSGTP